MTQGSSRGRHLIAADRWFATGSSLVARAAAPAFKGVLDRIDRGLAQGAIDVTLPDGNRRTLGGRAPGPLADVTLRSWLPLLRLATSGSVGWYRGWAEGEWTSPDPVPLFELFVVNRHSLGETGRAHGTGRILNRLRHLFRHNDRAGSKANIAFHYDLGNDFYTAWLDPGMTYSSAIFADPISADEPLEAAQTRKIRLLLDRLHLKPGDRLLEIGCGWGSLAEIAARDYGAIVTGITLSPSQKQWAEARIASAGLADRVTFELRDYRDVVERYDAVASVEMVEALGERYWPDYMIAVSRALNPGGRAAIQLISMEEATWLRYSANADFIQAYIFPGGLLIEEGRFRAAAQAAGLEWRDRHGFGLHYAETLRRWREDFDRAALPAGFDRRFADLWRYYLMYCEGGFRGGGIDVAQVTLVKPQPELGEAPPPPD